MPHMLHMIIACFTAVVFTAISALMVVASCDLNPISKAHLASPAAYTRVRIVLAKAVYVIATDCLDSILKVEVTLSAFCVAVIIWWNFRAVSARGAVPCSAVVDRCRGQCAHACSGHVCRTRYALPFRSPLWRDGSTCMWGWVPGIDRDMVALRGWGLGGCQYLKVSAGIRLAHGKQWEVTAGGYGSHSQCATADL